MNGAPILVVGDDRIEAMVVSVLGRINGVSPVPSSGLLAALRQGAAFAAIVDAHAVSAVEQRQFRALRRCGVSWPVIEIFTKGESRRSKGDWSADALAANECRTHLMRMLRAVINWALAAGADCIDRRREYSNVLCALLRAALLGDPPIGNVVELERATGWKHTVLFDAWRAGMQPLCGLTLSEFLGWVTLLRALGLKAPNWGWDAVARRLGTTKNRLARHCMARHGVALKELDEREGFLPVMQFIDRVLTPGRLYSVTA